MKKKMITFSRLAFSALLAVLVALLPCPVQGVPKQAPSVLQKQGPTDPQELEAFLDPIFAKRMEELHIPGAVFVLVKKGEIFFGKGYGYANLEMRTPVIPDKTIFRVASVSKLLTATAIMQLIERELLNLDDDVNKYLKNFKLEGNYPKPVTVANLLTHTGGFDRSSIGIIARSESERMPLGQFLAKRMPPRVLPPGELYSYSNYGLALAGHLVEVISGVPFAQYIDENILQPLGMHRSSFVLPPHLEPDLAVGYVYKNRSHQPVIYEYIQTVPASSLRSTATDMARFMIAHVQNGRYGDFRILSEDTAREMHSQQFTQHPRLPGMAYGFYEDFENDQRAIMHGGAQLGYHSMLYLLPEQNLGFLVSYNCLDVLGGREFEFLAELIHRFMDHYYPVQGKSVPPKPSADFQKQAHRFAGTYRSITHSRKSFEKLITLFKEYRVTANEDGVLTLNSPHAIEQPTRWVEVEPLLFQSFDGERYLAFREDTEGNITHLFFRPGSKLTSIVAGTIVLEKLPWYETALFHQCLLGFCVLIFLLASIAWPVVYFIRLLWKQPSEAARPAGSARLLAGLVSALSLVFIIGVVLTLHFRAYEFVYGVPPFFIALLCIPLATTIMTGGLFVFTILAWKNAYWSVIGRLHYSLVALAAMAFIWFLDYWNLLGFRF